MWMSLAPLEIADIRMTFTSLMTGASSPCRASASALISSRSWMTSTSAPSPSAGIASSARAAAAGVARGLDLLDLRRVIALQRVVDGALRRHDGLDVVPRHELDVVHGEDVGRVRHRDGQRGAVSRERDDLVLVRGLARDQLDHRRVDVELEEVDGGDAVLLAQQRGDVFVLDEAQFDQNQAELPSVGLLIGQ